ncbi:MAG: cation diffusion facilitator family transporter [Proteobacteria bacterium]|jgi:solute carrier family 30 (zinc transporter), member 9|nr:cation diffusion facilitator family transporter [Pseudomonadota bacterium]
MAAGGSKLVVYSAIVANTIVMIAKFIGFFATGSGAMLSEGIHSCADVGNQALLAVGMKRGTHAADKEHPFGFGREAFVWALISATGIFFLGAGVTLTHGIQSLMEGGHVDESGGSLNIIILIIALVAEGIPLGIAIKSLHTTAKHRHESFFSHVKNTDDPFSVAVLLEDSAAILGVIIALAAVGLTQLTQNGVWDALGSILIGCLLGLVALFLIAKNRDLLIGKAIHPADRERLRKIFEEDPAIEKVAASSTAVTGAGSYRISAELDFDGRYLAGKYIEKREVAEILGRLDSPAALEEFLGEYSEAVMELVGDEVDRLEKKIRHELPKAKRIDLEPD